MVADSAPGFAARSRILPLVVFGLFGSLGILALGGCARDRPVDHAELETVDVAAAPDADASLEGDTVDVPVAAPAAGGQGVAGALPADFPRDVPLPKPSSLVDFGPGWIGLDVVGDLEGVRTAYLHQLAEAGFGAREDQIWQRGARRIRVRFTSSGGVTRIRLDVLASG